MDATEQHYRRAAKELFCELAEVCAFACAKWYEIRNLTFALTETDCGHCCGFKFLGHKLYMYNIYIYIFFSLGRTFHGRP